MIVNMHEAKTRLSRLVEQVLEGDEVVIANNGRPVARLVPYRESGHRQFGSWAERLWIAEDFDETPDELIDAFYGEADEG